VWEEARHIMTEYRNTSCKFQKPKTPTGKKYTIEDDIKTEISSSFKKIQLSKRVGSKLPNLLSLRLTQIQLSR
jgi:hypothetical protein